MFRCRDVSEKISQSLDGSLPIHYRLAIRFHLLMCRYCTQFRRQLIMLRKASQQIESNHPGDAETGKLSEETKSRIKENLSR
jgi:hypothetical protein